MATGLLYDLHGNLPALEAVLRDARETPVTRWVLGGDYASFGAWPAEVIERLDELQDATWIRGNWDRWQGGDRADMLPGEGLQGALATAVEELGPDVVARLAALPGSHRDGDTLFCHAAPDSDMDSFLPERSDHDDELLEGVDARRVVFGHTHLPVDRVEHGIQLVNPGSVGLPFDGDTRASWAVLHDDGRVERRRVAYDIEATIDGLRTRLSGAAWTAGTMARLRKATFDGQ
jgi:diadenosine tetraphosphatase ApaH/serine/threonine PP2A family protein phosphatase